MIDLVFLQSLGYVGVFFAGFLSTFTLFLPSPTFVLVFLLSSTLNPLLLGIVGGLGATIGETIGYAAGYGLRFVVDEKKKKKLARVEKMMEKYNAFIVIFIFAITPLPFDLVGMFCGITEYSKKRFFIATLLGKVIKYIGLAYAGYFGMSWIMDYFFG